MSGLYSNGLPAAAFPLTGAETIAVDTNLSGGQAPQSESATVAQIKGFERAAVALTDATSIATDASAGNTFTVTLAGNRTLANPTNLQSGGSYRWVISQDGTGSRTLAFGNLFTFSGSSTITTTASAVDVINALYDGTKLRAVLSKAYS